MTRRHDPQPVAHVVEEIRRWLPRVPARYREEIADTLINSVRMHAGAPTLGQEANRVAGRYFARLRKSGKVDQLIDKAVAQSTTKKTAVA